MMMTQTRCHSMHSATRILWLSSRRAGHPVGCSPCRSEVVGYSSPCRSEVVGYRPCRSEVADSGTLVLVTVDTWV